MILQYIQCSSATGCKSAWETFCTSSGSLVTPLCELTCFCRTVQMIALQGWPVSMQPHEVVASVAHFNGFKGSADRVDLDLYQVVLQVRSPLQLFYCSISFLYYVHILFVFFEVEQRLQT